jgi:hypothetical protein
MLAKRSKLFFKKIPRSGAAIQTNQSLSRSGAAITSVGGSARWRTQRINKLLYIKFVLIRVIRG